MKFVPRMLSIFSMILKWAISPYAEHARKLFTRWLSMREPALWNRNYFLRFWFRLLKSFGSGSGF
jgi:hypothetical protein